MQCVHSIQNTYGPHPVSTADRNPSRIATSTLHKIVQEAWVAAARQPPDSFPGNQLSQQTYPYMRH